MRLSHRWSTLAALGVLAACTPLGLPVGEVAIHGQVSLPPELISNNGSKIISNNGGAIVSPNGSSIVSPNGSGYRVASVGVLAAAGTTVDLYRWDRGTWQPAGTGTTDASGEFGLAGLQAGELYLVSATGSFLLTPRALVSLDASALRSANLQAGSWTGYTLSALTLPAPVGVSVGSTIVDAAIESEVASGDVGLLDQVTDAHVSAMDQAVDAAVTPDEVAAMASGSAPLTIYAQLASDPAVSSAAGALGLGPEPSLSPSPSPTPTPLSGNIVPTQ